MPGKALVAATGAGGFIGSHLTRALSASGAEIRRSVVSEVLTQANLRGTIRVRDTRPVRDFCFVDDVAAAVVAACRVEVDRFAAVNVGTGVGTSIATLAQVCGDLTGATDLEESGARRPPGTDGDRLVANTDLARSLLGWVSSTSLRDGLQHTLAAMAAL